MKIGHLTWTGDMVKRLEEHWKAGTSITQIAIAMSREFGVRLSRNAVVGKAHRLGLTKEFKREPGLPRQPKASAPATAPKPVVVETAEHRAAALFRAGQTPQQISATMRVTLGSAKVYLSNARRKGILPPIQRPEKPAAKAASRPPVKVVTEPARPITKPSSIKRAASLLLEGHSLAEIARRMDVKESTATIYLSHARTQGLIAASDVPAWYSPSDIKPLPDQVDHFGTKGCQWIEGDPKIDPTMCGAERVPTRPYCQAHCRRAYIVIQPAKKEAA